MILRSLLSLVLISAVTFTARATTHTISAEDFKFQPPNITVVVGDSIKWVWDDSGSDHTTTSTSTPAGAPVWDKVLDAEHPEFIYVITQPGTYSYKCTFHEAMNMVGVITATGSPVAIETTDSGTSLNVNVNTDAGLIQIGYTINMPALINISILDIQGRLMDALPTEIHTPGSYAKTYSIADLPKGVYIIQLQAENTYVTKKISIE